MANLNHFQNTENTSVIKSFHGWQGKTTLRVKNQDWVITTMKRSSGKIISYAQAVKGNANGNYQYEMFEDKSVMLLSVKKNATEAAIKAAHYEALAKFDTMNDAGELPENSAYEIKPGQLLRFEGYGHFMEIKYVVYEVTPGEYGPSYKCIDLLQKEFTITSAPRPVSEVFGIGCYYNAGEVMEQDELNNLIIEVSQLTKERELQQDTEAVEAEQAKAKALVKGATIIPAIPDEVKAVIIGEYMQDDSDPMTDYYSCHCTKVVFLAFSTHTRDLFDEMRKAAVNSEFTKHLVNGEEHREKYSGGQGFYIGGYRSGWRVSKLIMKHTPKYLEMLQLAAGADLYFIPSQTVEPVKNKSLAVQIIDYSEKAIAVIGDTKPIKDQLKALGGKFNFRLSCGAGWIFSKKHLSAVQNLIA